MHSQQFKCIKEVQRWVFWMKIVLLLQHLKSYTSMRRILYMPEESSQREERKKRKKRLLCSFGSPLFLSFQLSPRFY